jgi:hypothetical protein
MITFNDSFSQAAWQRLFKVWENVSWDSAPRCRGTNPLPKGRVMGCPFWRPFLFHGETS